MELFRALGALAEPPQPESREIARLLALEAFPERSDYSDLFLFQLYPYASVYLGPEGMMGGEARDRIAGFWRALETEPPPEPDHLAVMLACYAQLVELEEAAAGRARREARRHARKSWLWEHLASWLPVFLAKLDRLAPPFYRAWGGMLHQALLAEAAALGPPDRLPLHLRDAPSLGDPRREGGGGFLQELLTPVRSGFILTRSDLERAAHDLGLGARAGERAFTLRALLAQDSLAVLGWLAAEAESWAEGHRSMVELSPDLAGFWSARAQSAAALLEDLAGDARSRP